MRVVAVSSHTSCEQMILEFPDVTHSECPSVASTAHRRRIHPSFDPPAVFTVLCRHLRFFSTIRLNVLVSSEKLLSSCWLEFAVLGWRGANSRPAYFQDRLLVRNARAEDLQLWPSSNPSSPLRRPSSRGSERRSAILPFRSCLRGTRIRRSRHRAEARGSRPRTARSTQSDRSR